MSSTNQQLPRWYWLSAATPVLLFLIAGPLQYSLYSAGIDLGKTTGLPISAINNVLLLIAGLASTAVFVHQVRSATANGLPRRAVTMQLVLLITAAILPPLAGIIGDRSGAAAFHDSPDFTGLHPELIFLALVAPAILVMLFALGNTVLLAARQSARRGLQIIGVILYGLLAVALAVFCYVVYSLTYSAHDPTTE